MKKIDHSKVIAQIEDILVPNASFYRNSPHDENMYLLDFSIVTKLAYELIQYAADIFGAALPLIGIGRWAYRKYFLDASPPPTRHESASRETAQESIVIQGNELKDRLSQLYTNLLDQNLQEKLCDDIRRILEFHGWPSTESAVDARKIVEALVKDDSIIS